MMSHIAESLGINRLSLAERIQLAEELWDGIAAETAAADIPQSHKDELDRRIAAHRDNPQGGSSWADVQRRLTKD